MDELALAIAPVAGADGLDAVVHTGEDYDATMLAGYEAQGCFKLLSCHGTYLRALKGAPWGKEVRGGESGQENDDVWMLFKWRSGDKEYALCNYATHRFLTADDGHAVTCNRDHVDAWERWQLHRQGGKVGLLCLHSKHGARWLGMKPSGEAESYARVANEWEKFTLVPFRR